MSSSHPWSARLVSALLLPIWLLALGSSAAATHAATHGTTADPVAIIASAQQAIETANTGWLPAMERGDADAIAAAYAADGVLITSKGEAVRGRSAIAARYRAEISQLGQVVGGGLVQEGVTVSNGLIYEWGHGWLAFRQKDGKHKVSSGPYLTVWCRGSDGKWAIIRNLVL
ncbi:MAG: YybH family protein [Acetobacteraceae bacterium]